MAGITWWTSDRIARLSALAVSGATARQIAKVLSRGRRVTAEAVRKQARAAGIPLLARGGRPKGGAGRKRPRTARQVGAGRTRA